MTAPRSHTLRARRVIARFAANIDKHGEGLTTFLVAAIRAAHR